jgi:hypothetical protein
LKESREAISWGQPSSTKRNSLRMLHPMTALGLVPPAHLLKPVQRDKIMISAGARPCRSRPAIVSMGWRMWLKNARYPEQR